MKSKLLCFALFVVLAVKVDFVQVRQCLPQRLQWLSELCLLGEAGAESLRICQKGRTIESKPWKPQKVRGWKLLKSWFTHKNQILNHYRNNIFELRGDIRKLEKEIWKLEMEMELPERHKMELKDRKSELKDLRQIIEDLQYNKILTNLGFYQKKAQTSLRRKLDGDFQKKNKTDERVSFSDPLPSIYELFGETTNALVAFQKYIGVHPSAEFDNSTMKALNQCKKLSEDLASVRFRGDNFPEKIRRYQKYRDLEVTEHINEKSLKQIQTDLIYLKCVVAEGKQPSDRSIGHLRQEDITHVLMKKSDCLELYTNMATGPPSKPIRGVAAIKKMDQLARQLVKKNSDEEICFLYVSPLKIQGKNKFKIYVGADHVEVSPAKMHRMRAGSYKIHPLDSLLKSKTGTKMVIWPGPFSRGIKESNQPELRYNNSLRFAIELSRRYGDRHDIYLDDDIKIARDNAANLPNISGPTDVAALIPFESFKVSDYDVIDQIKDILSESGIRVSKVRGPIQESNLLIITGHKNQQFRDYIEHLGKAGVLKGKHVVLFSCYKAGDEEFNSKNIKKFGIRGIHFFSETIHPQAVQEVIVELSKILRDKQKPGTKSNKLLIKSIKQALKTNSQSTLRQEIEKMRHGITQISFIQRYGYKINSERLA